MVLTLGTKVLQRNGGYSTEDARCMATPTAGPLFLSCGSSQEPAFAEGPGHDNTSRSMKN